MNRKKEPCRNFQRGSCRYGEHCKFLHGSQQQQQQQSQPSNNPFGFGQHGSQFQNTNQQQQKPNPFGFGTQNNSQPKGGSNFGTNFQNQPKPFENKWNRFSAIAPTNNTTSSQKGDSQPQVANHTCTDPEACKRIIAEDFKSERPLWKLTCYAHWKHLPCDISGDVSYEELRAAAYDDSKRGISLQSIIERERNLYNSKMLEFENLLRNPYVKSQNTANAAPSSIFGIDLNAPPPNVQNSAPPFNAQNNAPSFGVQNNVAPFGVQNNPPLFGVQSNAPSFGGQNNVAPFGAQNNASPFIVQNNVPPFGAQKNASPFGVQSSMPPSGAQNNAPPSVSSFSQLGVSLGSNTSQPAPSTNTFGQTILFPNSNQNSGPFGAQVQPFGNASNIQNFGSNVMNGGSTSSSVSSATPSQFLSSASNQSSISSSGLNAGSSMVGEASTDNKRTSGFTGDASIWLKESWDRGEIPEEAPPAAFI